MHRALLSTSNSWELMVMRVAVGVMILPHGLQKTFGWFDGRGFAGQITMFADKYHMPPWLSVLAIAAECLGGLGLIFGLLTRVAAFGVLCNMVVGALMVARPFGFFMNWSGKQGGEGYEFHILAIALLLALVSQGGGLWSIDRAFEGRRSHR